MNARISIKHLSNLLKMSSKNEEDASQHPGLYGRKPLGPWRVCRDRVEYDGQHQKESDKETHTGRNDVRRNQETHPGDDDQEAGRQVVGDDVGGDVTAENDFESGQRKISERAAEKDGVVFAQWLDGDGVVEADGVRSLGWMISG